MPSSPLLIRRLELKYKIPAALVPEVRERLRAVCSLDPHADPALGGYTVNNLYFDTPTLRFYYDTKFRELTRFKLRARYYGTAAPDTMWLEVKHRQNSLIWKTRRPIAAAHWEDVLSGEHCTHRGRRMVEWPGAFEDAVFLHGARSVAHVRYFREAYVSELESYGRVTFDTRLSFRAARGELALDAPDEPWRYYDDPQTTGYPESPAVLEIKVENDVPMWAVALVRSFGLVQGGFSKYCYAIDRLLGEEPTLREAAGY